MKTPEQRGKIGAWAYGERVRLDISVEEAVERLAGAGVTIGAPYLRGIEAGRRPSLRVLGGLAKVYSSQPPEEETNDDVPSLVKALHAQTEALSALVGELQLARLAREGIELGAKRAAKQLRRRPPGAKPAR